MEFVFINDYNCWNTMDRSLANTLYIQIYGIDETAYHCAKIP